MTESYFIYSAKFWFPNSMKKNLFVLIQTYVYKILFSLWLSFKTVKFPLSLSLSDKLHNENQNRRGQNRPRCGVC